MLLSRKKKHKKTQKATTKQTKTATTYNSPCIHHKCYQAIARNDQYRLIQHNSMLCVTNSKINQQGTRINFNIVVFNTITV